MKYKIIFAVVFSFFYNAHMVSAEFLNIGGSEIILILLSIIFMMAFVVGIVLLINFLARKPNAQNLNYPVNHIKINLDAHQKQSTNIISGNEKISSNLKISLPQQNEVRYVYSDEILRCEADDNYTNFYFFNGDKILISKPLKEYADLLTPYGFIRSHQSHLVNPKYVKSWLKEDGGVLLMNNGDKIPVSKPNRDKVKELLSG